MPTGSTIPYHLRQNKAVERILFEEQLSLLSPWLVGINENPIEEYRYVGFGGPFLEDFKSIHRNLNITDMISIECDQNTLIRQKFNKPISCIEILENPMNSSEFINKDQFLKPSILWLDFVSTDYDSQLNDIRQATEKMSNFDIIKVTFNANVANINGEHSDLQGSRCKAFKDSVSNEYLPRNLNPEDFIYKRFHNILLKTIENSFINGVSNKNNTTIKILSAFVYKDGQQMLTVTCILLPKNEIENFESNSKFGNWDFYYNNETVYDISLPSLSIRERVEIERLLPCGNIDEIKQHLGYSIGRSATDNDLLLKNFINYHSRFPWFGKISL
ncbi:MAG: hypothetical protein ACI9NA_000290 [Gammaproteobacteria bacterium]|jgi:hypothetical protein